MGSISPSSSATSSSHNRKHQVFLNFRGPDVRKTFLSHLRKELKRKAIDIFIDSNIQKSKTIGRELYEAIEGSRIAIVILSRNYASSSWCLDELVKIIKCRGDFGQTLITIFYNVDPTDVRNQTGDFGKVFKETWKDGTTENIERWRCALAKVSQLAGYHSSQWDNEAAMIEEITTDISNKLSNSTPSRDFEGLVGMEDHMEKFKPLLRLDLNDVRIIGIWGPSGMGKTSFARYLYSKHSHEFELSVFMEDIKGFARPSCSDIKGYARPSCSDKYALKLGLQQQLLSEILDQKDIVIPHLGVVQDRLKDKKVFIVIDDVYGPEQLEALAKENQWFGPGSRIIITTQNLKLLKAHEDYYSHQMDFPTLDEAFQIFCMNAFGQNSPKDGFEELASDAMYLSGIHPLGISGMGSFFRGKSKQEWRKEMSKQERKEALITLRTNPGTHNPMKHSRLGVKIRMSTQKVLSRTLSKIEKIQAAPAEAEAYSDNLMMKTKQKILSRTFIVVKKIHKEAVEAEAARIYGSCKKEIDESTNV